MNAALNVPAAPDDYEYDVFISYPHEENHRTWVHRYFVPKLRLHLRNTLFSEPRIYLDADRLDPGATWPLNLKRALARSRVMIPVWSIDYFLSPWCTAECSVMLYREQKLGLRALGSDMGLILPIRLFDGDGYPPFARQIQALDCNEYNITVGNFDQTPKHSELAEIIKKWTPQVAARVRNAPKWCAEWETPEWLDEPIRRCGVDPTYTPPKDGFVLAGIG